ncbi:MAG TPA: mechanosensitive ion channel [Blastocatellia bacterium]|nr:mechanosensitive ion channel [Blastocatellia bacterium]HMZ17365.1 mechanosensitive ion channel [Blastocatellia bacterium]HNG28606.1 mechanosensitive ion channel [Blastocatellia bacterium]
MLFCLFAVLFLSAATVQAQTPSEQGIPLLEIATRAEQIKRPLRELAARLSPNSELEPIVGQLNIEEAQLDAQAKQIEERIAATPTLYELRELERDWRMRSQEISRWLEVLTRQAAQAEADLRWINEEQARWAATLNQVSDSDALEAVFERIRTTLAELRRLQPQAEERLNRLLSLQDRVSQLQFLVAQELDHLAAARQRFQSQLLARDNRPLWSAFFAPDTEGQSDSRSFIHELAAARENISAQRSRFLFLVLLFVAALLLNISLAKRLDALTADDDGLRQSASVLKRPVSVALLVTLLVFLWLSPLSASIVNSLVALLLLIPFLRVVRLLVEPPAWLRIPFYAVALLHLSDQTRFLADIDPLIERLVFLAENLIGIGVIAWMLRPARFGQLVASAFALKTLRGALWAMLGLLAIALLANVFGFVTLAKLLGEGTLHSAYYGGLLYGAARVVIIISALLLRTPRVQRSVAVRENCTEITFWWTRACYLIAGFLWLHGTLEQFTIREQVAAALERLLDASLSFRSLRVSFGDVLAFLVVAAAAYYLAKIIRVVLQEDVLMRIPLKRGVPQAIATAAQYLLLIFGFMLALTAAGFELNRLTLLTGAFGVGIGFGLQTVVNNFVSGLILLFERPVQLGDSVQVGGVSGDITHIGIRSSRIRTGQGAEVIIPNGKLLSDDVTNWTSMGQMRRVDIPVSVAYGADPAQVLILMVTVARSQPDVLPEPAPTALFTGFGDGAINFELRFWTSLQVHLSARTQVAVAILAAFEEAGISIPSRDLSVKLSDDVIQAFLVRAAQSEQTDKIEK